MSAKTTTVLFLCLCTIALECGRRGSPFLENTGEIPLRDSLNHPYQGLFMLLPTQYKSTTDVVRAAVTSQYGIEKDVEDLSPFSKVRSLSDAFKREKEDRAEVEKMGFCLDTIKQCEITSKRFNVIPSLRGYSELRLLIIDGRPILQRNYTFLAIKRYDDYWWWGREYHTGCQVPFKVNSSNDVITLTELRQLEKICNRMKISIPKYFNAISIGSSVVDPIMMKEMKNCLEEMKTGKSR
jgi:hypothetical protein